MPNATWVIKKSKHRTRKEPKAHTILALLIV
jgi:hypothetical protein